MSDQKITIGIETTANTTGAKQAETAIDDVVDKGRELDGALDKVDGGGLDKIPPKAKQAEKSIKDVQTETKKLGKDGSGGRALLEFSRAFEDAQFGINGVLNNLPGLITALGGTAGLAGIISVVAVAGSVLWGSFGKGTKKAKENTEDLTERLAGMLKVYKEFAALGADDREKAADAVAETLKDKLRGIDSKFKISVGAEGVAASLEAATATINLAKDKLALSRMEAALVTATGEQAARLAVERETIIKRIYQDELRIAEIPRTQAINVAQAKVTSAAGKVQETATSANALGDQYRAQRIIVDGLREEADSLQASRIFAVKLREEEKALLASQIKAMRKELDSTQSMDRANTLDSLIGQAENRIQQIDKASKDLTPLTKVLEAQTKFKAEDDELKKLEPGLKQSAEAQKAAADAMTAATLDLKNLRQGQNADRSKQEGIKEVSDLGDIYSKRDRAGQKTSGEVNAVVGEVEQSLGDVANQPPVRKMLDDVRKLAADGIQAGEQQEFYGLISQLVAKVDGGAEQTRGFLTRLIEAMDRSVSAQAGFDGQIKALSARISGLETASKQRNP